MFRIKHYLQKWLTNVKKYSNIPMLPYYLHRHIKI